MVPEYLTQYFVLDQFMNVTQDNLIDKIVLMSEKLRDFFSLYTLFILLKTFHVRIENISITDMIELP